MPLFKYSIVLKDLLSWWWCLYTEDLDWRRKKKDFLALFFNNVLKNFQSILDAFVQSIKSLVTLSMTVLGGGEPKGAAVEEVSSVEWKKTIALSALFYRLPSIYLDSSAKKYLVLVVAKKHRTIITIHEKCLQWRLLKMTIIGCNWEHLIF